jgi:hypothetical protein
MTGLKNFGFGKPPHLFQAQKTSARLFLKQAGSILKTSRLEDVAEARRWARSNVILNWCKSC